MVHGALARGSHYCCVSLGTLGALEWLASANLDAASGGCCWLVLQGCYFNPALLEPAYAVGLIERKDTASRCFEQDPSLNCVCLCS